jgi:hypothetical protein
MADIAVSSPLSVKDASHACQEAQKLVQAHARAYAEVRKGWDQDAIARARAAYGLARVEWAGDAAVLAEAEDLQDPVWAARRRPGYAPVSTGDVAHDRAWEDYQAARLSADSEAIARAREAWRHALVGYLKAEAVRHAAEDQERFAQMLERAEEQSRVDPEDAFRLRPLGRAGDLARGDRERDRAELLKRHDPGLGGWRPARRR